MRLSSRPFRALAATAVAALALTACGGGGSGSSSGSSGTGAAGGDTTFVFGASADPVIIDGAYVSDGESLRVIRQIFEGLVTTAAGKTDIQPALATDWKASADGLTWTFNLRQGVTFTDGEPFNGAAVCANFDRWYNFTGVQQSPSVAYYWTTVFGGFAKNEDPSLPASLYASCAAPDDKTAAITLTKPSSTFLSALSLPSFAMASPKALTEYKANDVSGTGDAPQFTGTFGTEHPIGTGPFKLQSWERGNQLALARNDDYWGTKASIKTLVFKPIADGPARRQALEAGEIDGYDLVDPADSKALADEGFQILRRPAFNVGYLGFNQAIPPLDNPKIREAIAHAINRENIVKTNYPEGSVVAKEFMPPALFGYAEDVPTYDYNVQTAKDLIAQSGVASPKLEFWYPTDVSRPYMPDPAANFQLMKADLEAAGFTVTTKSAPWNPDFLSTVNAGKAQMYLLGWTGDFGDPDNFIGTFFQTEQPAWGFKNPEIFSLLDQAEAEPDLAKRTALYQEANRKIMAFLPGLPYVHTEPALAFKADVKGFVPSPVGNEDFNTVSVGAQ
jgi:peptide/nickel transport system substrate-binding protein